MSHGLLKACRISCAVQIFVAIEKNDNRHVQHNAQQPCEGTQRLQNGVSMFLGMDEGGSTSSPVAGGFCMMNPEFQSQVFDSNLVALKANEATRQS